MGTILAFDTATRVATVALVRDGEVLGESTSQASHVLREALDLLEQAGTPLAALDGIVVGTGPGSFTGVRIGIAAAHGLALGLVVPVAGVSTLDALAAGTPGALPVIDAGRREVFVPVDGEPRALPPTEVPLEPGAVCVGDGARRYRDILEAAGATVPPDDSDAHLPRAGLHVALAHELGAADAVEPVYVRLPDAKAFA
jgi:tRNA threonylcarbamoyladenosine biosynthesis protein TsaB